jgi:hypothetical protein
MLSYTVKRAFQEGDTWYTRENADEIKKLPRELRNDLIAQGVIEEHDSTGASASDAEPASPAKTSGKGK